MENTHFFTLTSATPYINSKQHPPETPSTYTHLTNSTYQQLPENPTCLLYEYNGLFVKSLSFQISKQFKQYSDIFILIYYY